MKETDEEIRGKQTGRNGETETEMGTATVTERYKETGEKRWKET